MNNTIRFFRNEVVDKSAKQRLAIVVSIMLFFTILSAIMAFA